MADSNIEWTDRSDWNPVRGCSRHSEGCRHCYAETIAGRFSGPGQPFEGFATRRNGESRWTGKVEVVWSRVLLPLSWTKPAMVFVNSASDLFHEKLPAEDIAQIYGVAVAAHHLRGHTFQILTKRADRARELLTDQDFWELVNSTAASEVIERTDPLNRRSDDARATLDDYGPRNPPPGIWLGTSVEDQRAGDERLLHLRHTPAVVRFVSCEPLLGPVALDLFKIDWVIAGGESGPGARPMEEAWARSLRDQCQAAGVAFFMKQMWGARKPLPEIPADLLIREVPNAR